MVSDLHLFTDRTLADHHAGEIQAAAQRSEMLVLAGDIFDFRWSRWPSAEVTADEAARWLSMLVAASPATDVHYILGNHDHVPALIERLERLAASLPRFHWYPFHLRLGNAVFLHGDVAGPGMTAERLEAYRERFAHAEPAHAAAHRMYGAAIAMGLHVLGARLLFPENSVVRRLTRHLQSLGPEWSDDVRNVYFGHTHLALDGVEHRGRRFHNCGAPMRGLRFRIIEADLS